MKDGKLLLDTDIVIASFRRDPGAEQALYEAKRLLIPVVVIGELIAGALQGRQTEREMARIDALLANGEVLDCDLETAHHYGEVRTHLRRQGRPIPENDIWIAALARQHDAPVASRDAHYDAVPGPEARALPRLVLTGEG
ncbi:type II toxin-antitoxin system VapC family toxin [Longimicrobium sp.]|uniref:type II toxin-antitoxin system VapC family toxin n=1 Tax=Longimicrobium sp. TaxID=2029185 RepID=UPI002E332C94|nr:type II toxin-antitoxin system VapC family toxin [Longimicrobium sp.]HEX6037597.1 type II toxin-antitoxin system VapC family toxin [Longimicrobium sp.]